MTLESFFKKGGFMNSKLQILVLTVFGLFSATAFSKTDHCAAGKKDLILFQVQADVAHNKMTLTFDSKQGEDGQVVAGKSVTLVYNPDQGSDEWHYHVGKILINPDFDHYFDQYIYIELGRFIPATNHLVGNFAISPPSFDNGPKYLSHMDLNCN